MVITFEIWKLTSLGMAVSFLTFVGLVVPNSISAQQTGTCSTGTAVPDPDNNPGLVSDCEALLASRDTLAGDATLDWSADTLIVEWEGVAVGGTPERVTELILQKRRLNGALPPELGRLANLARLNLFHNQLTGPIPSELGSLANLLELHLSHNRLTGQIPTELSGLANLETLYLHYNQLTGNIPGELASLSNLTGLSLGGNELTGNIPGELAGLSNLAGLFLNENKMTTFGIVLGVGTVHDGWWRRWSGIGESCSRGLASSSRT